MFLDSLDIDQVTLDSKCLTFLVLYGEKGEHWDVEDRSPQVGQTYSPETGIVSWPNRIGPDAIPPLSLRSNSQLAQWEPMTPEKFKLMALDRGVIGEDVKLPGRVVQPNLAAVAVTPSGFVFRWGHTGQLWISDVRRLAELKHPIADTWNDAWSEYAEPVERGTTDPPHAGSARIGDGSMPFPYDDSHLAVTSLADCSNFAGTLVSELGHDPEAANYTPETATFIQNQFGVNVRGIKDWREANRHRLLNSLFGQTAPFDHTTACTALRLTIDRSRPSQKVHGRLARAVSGIADRTQRHRPAQ